MKLYITHDDNTIDGFTTIRLDQIDTISSKFYKNQITEIYAPTILNYIEFDKYAKFLTELLSLVKVGGVILVGGIESSILCSSHIRARLAISDLNSLLFCSTPMIKSLCSLTQVKNFFLDRTRIEDICLDETECRFTIKVKKNGK